MRTERAGAAAAFAGLLRRHLERQHRLVLSHTSDWENTAELTADLYGLSLKVTGDVGEKTALSIGGVYDVDRTLEYLSIGSERSAKAINASSAEGVSAAGTDQDLLAAVFSGTRAELLGESRGTAMVGFGQNEAGAQVEGSVPGVRVMKTWQVTSQNSRHPDMDGEVVGIADVFSNGLRFPGDPAGDVGEVANCRCVMEIVREEGL